jgi:ABC-type antimicrobial peptide transport system permease subunit
MDARLAPARVAAHWLGGLGLLGMFLAVVGIYGLVSYLVGLRRRELAIRQALGASPRDLILGVARGGLILAAIGFALGTAPAIGLSRLLGDLTPGASTFDATAFAASALVVGVASLWASAWPARRAASATPGRQLNDP